MLYLSLTQKITNQINMQDAAVDQMVFNREGLSDELLLNLYNQLLYPRLIEDKMLKLLRQGKISKMVFGHWSGSHCGRFYDGLAPRRNDLPDAPQLGVFTSREVPFNRLFAQWQGKYSGFSKGRERSFHFGTLEHHIVGMISHLGPQLSLAAGVGLAHKLSGEARVSLTYTGDGATSEGEFHEALNVAAVWQLPVIFLIENNGYGLSTPPTEQYRCAQLADSGHWLRHESPHHRWQQCTGSVPHRVQAGRVHARTPRTRSSGVYDLPYARPRRSIRHQSMYPRNSWINGRCAIRWPTTNDS